VQGGRARQCTVGEVDNEKSVLPHHPRILPDIQSPVFCSQFPVDRPRVVTWQVTAERPDAVSPQQFLGLGLPLAKCAGPVACPQPRHGVHPEGGEGEASAPKREADGEEVVRKDDIHAAKGEIAAGEAGYSVCNRHVVAAWQASHRGRRAPRDRCTGRREVGDVCAEPGREREVHRAGDVDGASLPEDGGSDCPGHVYARRGGLRRVEEEQCPGCQDPEDRACQEKGGGRVEGPGEEEECRGRDDEHERAPGRPHGSRHLDAFQDLADDP